MVVAAALLVGGAAGCQSRRSAVKPETSARHATSAVSHDAQLLGKLLKLPAPPLEVSFEEVPLGAPGGLGPTDYLLVAVLRFDAGALARLAAAAEAAGSSAHAFPGDETLPGRAWFPEALKARLTTAGDAGATVRGRAIDAAAIFRPRYSMGRGVIVDGTDYVVLVAQTS